MKISRVAAAQRIKRLASDVRYMFEPRPIENPKFALSDLSSARRYFDEHGWVIIRDAFTRDEIARLREGVITSEREGRFGDLLSNPYLGKTVSDQRIVRIAEALLPERPTYFGDSAWNSGTAYPIQMGFHKDNPDKDRQDGPDWRSAYSIIRMGIYLQDNSRYSGGLGIRDGSHRTIDVLSGRPVAAPSDIGDVVIWSLRTSHTGFVSRLHGFPNAFVPISLQNRLTVRGPHAYHPQPFFRPAEHPERLALFITFGVNDHHLRRYIRYLKTRRYAVKIWQDSVYTDEMRERLRSCAVTFMDLAEQVRGVDITSVPEEHAQLPDD